MERITSRENQQVKELVKLLSSKRQRWSTGRFVLEGVKLLEDAVKSGLQIQRAFVTERAFQKYPQIFPLLQAGRVPMIFQITEEILQKIEDISSPQGVICIGSMLDNTADAVRIKQGGKYLLLSSLQDPGNVGTILRTAEAFALDGVFLSADCPDLYSPKVLRSAMGSVFRLPAAIRSDLSLLAEELKRQKIPLFGAALKENALPITEAGFSKGACIAIGNEGNGLSQEVMELCDQAMIIPMKGRAQSLNAASAAAIAVWEMTRSETAGTGTEEEREEGQ